MQILGIVGVITGRRQNRGRPFHECKKWAGGPEEFSSNCREP